MNFQVEVTKEFDRYRLDRFLAQFTGDDVSRSMIQKWIRLGNVAKLPEHKVVKANYVVREGENFHVTIPPKKKILLQPVKMDIPIVREYPDFLLIHKPAGIACHAGPGNSQVSLVNGLLYHFQSLSSQGGEERPGIVHRLDKPTSGLMLVAKNDRAHIALSSLFQKGQIYKRYYAWLLQAPREIKGRIELPIGRHKTERLKMCIRNDGRMAITNYKVLRSIASRKSRYYSLVEVEIETGRTHQIRVHFQNMGCPVVGDNLYSHSSEEFSKFGLLLFAQKLSFVYPPTGEAVEAELPFPENFLQFEKTAEFK